MVCFSRSANVVTHLDKRFNWKEFATQLQSSNLTVAPVPSGEKGCRPFNQGNTRLKKICEDTETTQLSICEGLFNTGPGTVNLTDVVTDGRALGTCEEMCATGGMLCEAGWDQDPDPDITCKRNLLAPRTNNGCTDRYNTQICRCYGDRDVRTPCEAMQEAFLALPTTQGSGRNTLKQICQGNNTTHAEACEALFWTGMTRTCDQQCALTGMQCVYGYDQTGDSGNALAGPGACSRQEPRLPREDGSVDEDGCDTLFQTQICACKFPGATTPPPTTTQTPTP